MSTAPDPWAIAEALRQWASDTDWVDWVELGGSLGRGGGDALSDVDAGIGVDDPAGRLAASRAAAEAFAPVAGTLVQDLGGVDHLMVVYRDGRQLSLVVFDQEKRDGLPPEATALVDKSDRLATELGPERWDADDATAREWTFLAWIAIGDAARHALRDHPWRALKALTDGRDNLWRLHARTLGLPFPAFGAVTVENADAAAPPGMRDTHPKDLSRKEIYGSLEALASLLEPHTEDDLAAVAATVAHRVGRLAD